MYVKHDLQAAIDMVERHFLDLEDSKAKQQLRIEALEMEIANLEIKTIEKAQRKIEGYHFDIRKQRLEEDNVANDQRSVVYACRDDILTRLAPLELLNQYAHESIPLTIEPFLPENNHAAWDLAGLQRFFSKEYRLDIDITSLANMSIEHIRDYLSSYLIQAYEDRTKDLDKALLVRFERSLILHYLDNLWREHLTHLELARQHVSLRGYAQKDPKQEYKLEAFKLFESFMGQFATSVISALMRAKFLKSDGTDPFWTQEGSRAGFACCLKFAGNHS
jgi:preprotein translocase subunit SecA